MNYVDLPVEEWLQFFQELGKLSVMDVCLSGGEPFIRGDLKRMLKGIAENHMRFSILSNGTLITRSMAKFISDSKRCNGIQISLDGSRPEVHDICRGRGSFHKAVCGIKILQQNNIPVSVRVTINRHNVHDLERLTRFILEELDLPWFSTNSAGYLGSCRPHASQLILNAEERSLAMKTLLRLSKEYPDRILADAGPLAEARRWRWMEAASEENDPPSCQGGRLSGCGCTFSGINVQSDGSITPCNMLPQIKIGRINQDSLQDVWLNSPALKQLRERDRINLSEFEFCRDCQYIPYCTGNCPGLAFSLTGTVDHPSPDACLRKFLAEGGELA